MPEQLHDEPFITKPTPRCLRDRDPAPSTPGTPHPSHPRRAVWPLRASFQHWAIRLLTSRSGHVA
jgi:hypothetical protein